MTSSMIVDLILWIVIAVIAIAWYVEYRNEKKVEQEQKPLSCEALMEVIKIAEAEDLRIYKKEGLGRFGHLPGKYSAVM